MKSKFIREERLSDGIEHTCNDNTLEIMGMKANSDACCARETSVGAEV